MGVKPCAEQAPQAELLIQDGDSKPDLPVFTATVLNEKHDAQGIASLEAALYISVHAAHQAV